MQTPNNRRPNFGLIMCTQQEPDNRSAAKNHEYALEHIGGGGGTPLWIPRHSFP